jgi:hypothetical protein
MWNQELPPILNRTPSTEEVLNAEIMVKLSIFIASMLHGTK